MSKKIYVLEIDEARLREMDTTLADEMAWVADSGITFKELEDDTVWRLTEADFLATMEDEGVHPDRRASLVEQAKQRFNIDSWSEYVQAFIDSTI